MNKGILEISQWLHEKGFEPDMWFDYDKTDGALFVCPEYVKDEFKNPSSANLSPWISLNRALELLPEEIRYRGIDYELYSTKRFVQYGTTHELGISFCRPFSFKIENKDTELAALRLLKQVVEKGYLKGESDEGSV